MSTSRIVSSEVGYALRLMLSTIPTLRAPAEQRSDFQMFKVEVCELLAATNPAIAAQCQDIADAAKAEAHALNMNY